jgi:ABC-type phosphate transport system permease subunit
MKLDVKAFALASGIVSGIVSLIMFLFAVITGQGLQYFEILAPFHPGYTPIILGAVIGTIWMLIYGLIIGVLFAITYNYFVKEN